MVNYTEAINFAIKQGTLNIRTILKNELFFDAPEHLRSIYLSKFENPSPPPKNETKVDTKKILIFEKHCGVKYDMVFNKFIIPKKS